MREPPFWETNGLGAHALGPLACLWTGARTFTSCFNTTVAATWT